MGLDKKISLLRKDIVGWTLYDFANTIYSMNIVSLYLKRYMVEELGHEHSAFDIPLSISMLLAAIFLPALGAISDHSTKKKLFVFLFTLSCCLAVGIMPVFSASGVLWLMVLLVIANFSYQAGQPFYNALLYSVSSGKQARYISGIGVALGYVGSVVGMIIVMPFVTGGFFSFDIPFIKAGGLTGAFLPTAILFFLFSIPLFVWVKEKKIVSEKIISIKQAYQEVWSGLRETKKYPGVLRFLIADMFFEDVAATVIINIGVYCSVVLQFDNNSIQLFLIVSTLTAVIGSFIIGKIALKMSLNKLLRYIILGWVVSLFAFALNDNKTVVWAIGAMIGISMGGLWTVTRPLLAELVPEKELGKFFGIFSMSGRVAAVIGPLIWTFIFYALHSERFFGTYLMEVFEMTSQELTVVTYKVAILTLALVMIAGLVIFRKVPEAGSHRESNVEDLS